MSGGYQTPAGDGLGTILRDLAEIRRRLAELEMPTGTSLTSLKQQVEAKLAELDATVTALVAAALSNYYTIAGTDAKVASPGNIAPGHVTASGNVTSSGAVSAAGEVSGNHATFPGGVNSTDVYNRQQTYGGGYKNQYIHTDGNMGYVPSSRQFKQDIEEWKFDPSIVSYLRVVTFRYIAAVENLGDKAEQELGLIAEELFELGYHWLVDYQVRYTAEGAKVPAPYQGEVEAVPFGVKYERICLILLSWAQSIELRLEAAGI